MTVSRPISSPAALCIILSLPLFFGIGQEIVAYPGSHDDYYFILRAVSLKMQGSYLAPIKEILYPLFIRLSWVYGLGLRNAEVLCYGIALYLLWRQLVNLSGKRLVAWLTILPLTLFSYQHPIFSHANYDALQLILMPLVFASAIALYTDRASLRATLAAGTVTALCVLNRPEGILYMLAPLTAVAALWLESNGLRHIGRGFKQFLPKIILLVIMALLAQQGASAYNRLSFGFWAPTLIKAKNFQRCLYDLMAIEPAAALKQHYITVPKTSLDAAYMVSPTLLKAKPLFDQHLNGYGWSSFAPPGYRAADGSISGGHFQWALLDAGNFAAGPDARAMLDYFGTIADELDAAFAAGKLTRRGRFITGLGPEFTPFDRSFIASLWTFSGLTFNFGRPSLPAVTGAGPVPVVDAVFNKVALRRTGLLESSQWQIIGWVIHPKQGVAEAISLDREALAAGIELTVSERPEVVRQFAGPGWNTERPPLCGITIKSSGPAAGNLQLIYNDTPVVVPLAALKPLASGQSYEDTNILLHVDSALSSPVHKIIPITSWITQAVFFIMRGMLCLALLLTAGLLLYGKTNSVGPEDRRRILFMAALAAAIVVPRLFLFAAIDSNMYVGTEIRYIAPGAFAAWLFGGFTVSSLLAALPTWRNNKQDTA